eukprot:6485849-Amphidinium_carterae.1
MGTLAALLGPGLGMGDTQAKWSSAEVVRELRRSQPRQVYELFHPPAVGASTAPWTHLGQRGVQERWCKRWQAVIRWQAIQKSCKLRVGSGREVRGFLDRGPCFSEPLQDLGRVRCGRMTIAEHCEWEATHRLDMSGGV